MFFMKKSQDKINVQSRKPISEESNIEHKQSANRKFYEHLAQGNALADAEETARRKLQ